MNKTELIQQLKKQIEKIESLKHPPAFHPQHQIWDNTTQKVVAELFDQDYLRMFKNAGSTSVYGDESSNYRQFIENLEEQKQLLEGFINEREELIGSSVPVSKKFDLGDYDLNPRIKAVIGKLFTDGHYKDAILKAYIEVIDRVKEVSGTPRASNGNELDGDNLMNRVFGSENPIIKLNELRTDANIDEQRGFMYLFKGICGLRNEKGHKNFVQDDPKRTIEHLALASLLMGLLEDDYIRTYNNS